MVKKDDYDDFIFHQRNYGLSSYADYHDDGISVDDVINVSPFAKKRTKKDYRHKGAVPQPGQTIILLRYSSGALYWALAEEWKAEDSSMIEISAILGTPHFFANVTQLIEVDLEIYLSLPSSFHERLKVFADKYWEHILPRQRRLFGKYRPDDIETMALQPENKQLLISITVENQTINIDLTSAYWRLTQDKTVRVLEMQDEHIKATILVLSNKLSALETLKNLKPDVYDLVKDHQIEGRTPDAWIEIFKLVLHERIKKKKVAAALAIKSKLDEMKTVEEKRADLEKQLKDLGFNLEDLPKQLEQAKGEF